MLLLILLAGCATAPPSNPDAPDPTKPLHGGFDLNATHLLGPEAGADADADVVAMHCGKSSNVFAYNLVVGDNGSAADTVTLRLANQTGRAELFMLAGFDDGATGLVASTMVRGGLVATLDPYLASFTNGWVSELPSTLSLPVASDGIAHFLLACHGEGGANYVVDATTSRAPHYLTPVVASGFDAFAAVGTDNLVISIPPSAGARYVTWNTIGDVVFDYQQVAGSGVRVGQTTVSWAADRPGWATNACAHQGWAEHGTWSYDSNLHGGPRSVTGFMADDIATLGLGQQLLFGAIEVMHTDEGNESASFAFVLDHVASSEVGWVTVCEGAHVGATVQELFGKAAERHWVTPRGLA